jgi:tetratricopeptide (TPR) repeat protein
MAGLLQRLGSAVTDDPGAATGADLQDLADQLHRTTQGRKLLVVLDDAASEEQVRPVLSAIPDAFTVVTSRRTLTGLDGARHLTLDVLRPNEAQDLLVSIVGSRLADDPAAAQEIARLCGYLPLAVRVAGSGLAARPHWSAAAWADRLADEGAGLSRFVAGDLDVRAGLLVAYREVGAAEQRAFRLLALAPVPDFPLWSAAALLDLPAAEAEHVVERLVESQLLGVRRNPAGHTYRYSFHRLLRKLALEQLALDPPGAVQAATERLGRAFLTYARHADSLLTPGRGSQAAERQHGGGHGLMNPASVVGDAPARWFQDETPGLVDAVRQAHAAGLWELTWQLTEALVGHFEAGSVWGDWALTHDLALDATRLAERPIEAATVLHSLGDLAWQQRRNRAAADHYENARAAFVAAADFGGQARCLVGLADVALSSGELGQAGKLYAEAAELFGAGDDARSTRGRADVLRGLALVNLLRGRTEDALLGFGEFIEVAQQLGDKRWVQFGSRSIDRIQEHVMDWATGHRLEALETRPGVWLVGRSQNAAANAGLG